MTSTEINFMIGKHNLEGMRFNRLVVIRKDGQMRLRKRYARAKTYGLKKGRKKSWHHPKDGYFSKAPNFLNNANTRPQMLAAMTDAELNHFIQLLEDHYYSGSEYKTFELFLIHLGQSTFCELWLRAKNLWNDGGKV